MVDRVLAKDNPLACPKMGLWRCYLQLTKPGIIFGNLIAVAGGFFMGSPNGAAPVLLLLTMLGMILTIAGGCVINNIIDRDIDPLMARTKNRPLAKNLLSLKISFVYGLLLAVGGLTLLYCATNVLTTIIAAIGLFFYVVVYSLWSKRHSVYGTALGAISGATPPVAGYCAATNRFDLGAVLLFLILFLWQMPHFYAISIYRLKDYTAASIPVLTIKKGLRYTKITMLIYIAVFAITIIMPTVFGYTGIAYLIVAIAIGLSWLYFGIQGLVCENDALWARKVFLVSIINLTLLCIMMAVSH